MAGNNNSTNLNRRGAYMVRGYSSNRVMAQSPAAGTRVVDTGAPMIVLRLVRGGVSDELVLGTRDAFAHAPGILRAWGENVVLPHPSLFAHMIAWGEFLGGLAFFLGALTRPAGIAIAFQFANFYFVGPETAKHFVLLLAVCGVGCAISRAGRKCGMDVFLDNVLPRWMTW